MQWELKTYRNICSWKQTMADFMDSDVQDELQAMAGAPAPALKVPQFGANRPLSEYPTFRMGFSIILDCYDIKRFLLIKQIKHHVQCFRVVILGRQ